MIAAERSDTDLPVAEGFGQIGVARVRWRLVTTPVGSPAEISRRAHDELAALVRAHDLFAWRGLERADARSKPRPIGAPDADVSISHGGDLILVAVSMDARIGVDIEPAPFRAFDSPALQRRMLTAAEAAASALLPDDDTRRAYLARVWTAKEAVVKATGSGLATDFRTLAVEAAVHARPQTFEAHLAVIPHGAELDDLRPPALRRLTSQETP